MQAADLLNVEDLPSPKEITDFSAPNIAEELIQGHLPVVLKGYAAKWPLLCQDGQPCSNEQMYNKLLKAANNADVPLVALHPDAKGRMFYSDDMQQMLFKKQNMPLPSALKAINDNPQSPGQAKLCVQCVSAKQYFPSLANSLGPLVSPDYARSFYWLGNDIKVAPHFDEAHNIAVVLAGRRRFTLFPPGQVHNLYVGPLDFTPAGQPISLVDINNPDLDAHPRYAEAFKHAFSVELEPGDAIFIPTPWWHHVQSLDNFNVLLNFWWDDVLASTQMPFPALVHALQAYRHLPEKQKASWQQLINHYVFSDNKDATGHLPETVHGILGKNTERKIKGVHNWLKQFLR